MKRISLITIKNKHKEILRKWRNEKITIKNSLSSKKVTIYEHNVWFKKRLLLKPKFFWLLKKNGVPIGTIRLDKKKKVYFISYIIDKKMRNLGYGKQILKEMLRKKNVLEIIKKNFIILAKVKIHNSPSIKTFLSNNFKLIHQRNKILTFQYQQEQKGLSK